MLGVGVLDDVWLEYILRGLADCVDCVERGAIDDLRPWFVLKEFCGCMVEYEVEGLSVEYALSGMLEKADDIALLLEGVASKPANGSPLALDILGAIIDLDLCPVEAGAGEDTAKGSSGLVD
jgi:hypothetical protein